MYIDVTNIILYFIFSIVSYCIVFGFFFRLFVTFTKVVVEVVISKIVADKSYIFICILFQFILRFFFSFEFELGI